MGPEGPLRTLKEGMRRSGTLNPIGEGFLVQIEVSGNLERRRTKRPIIIDPNIVHSIIYRV